jgi:hypothetical protein
LQEAKAAKIFQEFLHKRLNAVLGSHMDACLIKKLSQIKTTLQKITAALMLLVRKERKVTMKKKLVVSTLVKTPMETATSVRTHKVQDTRSWPNMLLVKSIGSTTSPLLGNLLQPMVTLVWDTSIKPKKTQNQSSMHALLTPKIPPAKKIVIKCVCGRKAPVKSPKVKNPWQEEEVDAFLTLVISECSNIEKIVRSDGFIGQIEYFNYKRFK